MKQPLNAIPSRAMPPAARVLVVLFGAIGDVVQALPLLTRLKQHDAKMHITWAIEPASRNLLEHHPLIDQVLCFERSRGLRGYRDFIRQLKASGPYDVVLDLQRHFKSGFTAVLSGGKVRVGFNRQGSREGNWLFQNECIPPVAHQSPKIKQFQLFADHFGIAALTKLEFGLELRPEEITAVNNLLSQAGYRAEEQRQIVPLVIGASWESKVWPPERFGQLAKKLYDENNLQPVLVGGKTELAAAAKIMSSAPQAIDLVGKTSLMQLAALFSKSAAVVACDSGPMHLAAAVGVPVISLWGPTGPARSAPYGSEHLILQSAIGCAPCYLRRCPGLGTLCLSDIPPEAVLARLAGVLPSARIADSLELG